jgi:hypothetical protein
MELPNLTKLDLSRTAVTDACVPHLQKIAMLRSVDLRGTHVSRRGRHELERGARIATTVDWDTSSFVAKNCNDSDLADLEWSSDLSRLMLDSPKITDHGLRYLRYVPNLVD